MKYIKLIETIVVTYYHENRDNIEEDRIEELLKESLNIKINGAKFEDNLLTVSYGNKKKVVFEFHNDKIKIKKDA